ncbi:unnamed protein product [Pleuronectes platessa]|uniref:Uncharacterized protein n=1 Tax=Pleuronectes platessa TaxID=8262 RepID=A0A9N7TX42_PLEPL|nr:unnamed protein product [Pleuronectes platessa]
MTRANNTETETVGDEVIREKTEDNPHRERRLRNNHQSSDEQKMSLISMAARFCLCGLPTEYLPFLGLPSCECQLNDERSESFVKASVGQQQQAAVRMKSRGRETLQDIMKPRDAELQKTMHSHPSVDSWETQRGAKREAIKPRLDRLSHDDATSTSSLKMLNVASE